MLYIYCIVIQSAQKSLIIRIIIINHIIMMINHHFPHSTCHMFSPRPPRWSQRACARSWRIRRPWKAGSLSWLQRPGFDMFRLKVGALWAPWNPRVYHWLIIILLVNMAILGGKLAVSRCGKIIWKVLRRCKEYPLCATAISLKYTELFSV